MDIFNELLIGKRIMSFPPHENIGFILCLKCRCSSSIAFWQIDNLVGTFMPADPATFILMGKAYKVRHVKYHFLKASPTAFSSLDIQLPSGRKHFIPQYQSGDL